MSGSKIIQIAPSLLSADFLNLERDVRRIAAADVPPEWLHIDVMDGHFVPNLTIGPVFVKSLKKITDIRLDVHLMIDNPRMQVDWYLEAGADLVVIHAESPAVKQCTAGVATAHPSLHKGVSSSISALLAEQADELREILQRIRAAGVLAGISLNPNTSPDVLIPLLGCFDLVLVMSVHPGFAAQSFIPSSLNKLERLVELREQAVEQGGATASFLIEIDGGINAETAAAAAVAGADILVAGNAIFGAEDPACALAQIRQSANAVLP